MNKTGVEKAEKRLAKASSCLTQVELARTYAEFEEAWSDILLAMNAVYTILEKSARSTPQSRQWYGAKSRERRQDPLLQYLHQARNADEHGLEPISSLHPGTVSIGAEGGLFHVESLTINRGRSQLKTGPENIGRPFFMITPPTAKLAPVYDDRFKQTFQPPTEHKGQPIVDASPLGVARLAMAHLRALVAEAKELAM